MQTTFEIFNNFPKITGALVLVWSWTYTYVFSIIWALLGFAELGGLNTMGYLESLWLFQLKGWLWPHFIPLLSWLGKTSVGGVVSNVLIGMMKYPLVANYLVYVPSYLGPIAGFWFQYSVIMLLLHAVRSIAKYYYWTKMKRTAITTMLIVKNCFMALGIIQLFLLIIKLSKNLSDRIRGYKKIAEVTREGNFENNIDFLRKGAVIAQWVAFSVKVITSTAEANGLDLREIASLHHINSYFRDFASILGVSLKTKKELEKEEEKHINQGLRSKLDPRQENIIQQCDEYAVLSGNITHCNRAKEFSLQDPNEPCEHCGKPWPVHPREGGLCLFMPEIGLLGSLSGKCSICGRAETEHSKVFENFVYQKKMDPIGAKIAFMKLKSDYRSVDLKKRQRFTKGEILNPVKEEREGRFSEIVEESQHTLYEVSRGLLDFVVSAFYVKEDPLPGGVGFTAGDDYEDILDHTWSINIDFVADNAGPCQGYKLDRSGVTWAEIPFGAWYENPNIPGTYKKKDVEDYSIEEDPSAYVADDPWVNFKQWKDRIISFVKDNKLKITGATLFIVIIITISFLTYYYDLISKFRSYLSSEREGKSRPRKINRGKNYKDLKVWKNHTGFKRKRTPKERRGNFTLKEIQEYMDRMHADFAEVDPQKFQRLLDAYGIAVYTVGRIENLEFDDDENWSNNLHKDDNYFDNPDDAEYYSNYVLVDEYPGREIWNKYMDQMRKDFEGMRYKRKEDGYVLEKIPQKVEVAGKKVKVIDKKQLKLKERERANIQIKQTLDKEREQFQKDMDNMVRKAKEREIALSNKFEEKEKETQRVIRELMDELKKARANFEANPTPAGVVATVQQPTGPKPPSYDQDAVRKMTKLEMELYCKNKTIGQQKRIRQFWKTNSVYNKAGQDCRFGDKCKNKDCKFKHPPEDRGRKESREAKIPNQEYFEVASGNSFLKKQGAVYFQDEQVGWYTILDIKQKDQIKSYMLIPQHFWKEIGNKPLIIKSLDGKQSHQIKAEYFRNFEGLDLSLWNLDLHDGKKVSSFVRHIEITEESKKLKDVRALKVHVLRGKKMVFTTTEQKNDLNKDFEVRYFCDTDFGDCGAPVWAGDYFMGIHVGTDGPGEGNRFLFLSGLQRQAIWANH